MHYSFVIVTNEELNKEFNKTSRYDLKTNIFNCICQNIKLLKVFFFVEI